MGLLQILIWDWPIKLLIPVGVLTHWTDFFLANKNGNIWEPKPANMVLNGIQPNSDQLAQRASP